jgi:hypothetical protein
MNEGKMVAIKGEDIILICASLVKACDTLMDEVSGHGVTKWGIVNDALLKARNILPPGLKNLGEEPEPITYRGEVIAEGKPNVPRETLQKKIEQKFPAGIPADFEKDPEISETFLINWVLSDKKHFYIDVAGKGTVQIQLTNEGIIVDIYPLNVSDEACASTYAFNAELLGLRKDE